MPTKAWIEHALATLCEEYTKLDFSGQRLDAGDVVFIASAIGSTVQLWFNFKALLKLDISNTDLNAEGGTIVAEALDGNQMMTELNIANNCLCIKVDRYDM
jgi:hypothetical protein